MPGITTQITNLLLDYINTTEWFTDMIGRRFYRENNIPGEVVAPYAAWGWVTVTDTTASISQSEENSFQITMYGSDDIALDEIRDAVELSLSTRTDGSADIGFNILVYLERNSGFRATENEKEKRDRFGKYVAMSEFHFRVEKTYT